MTYFGICPVCGASFDAPPALSRDGKTHICPECGIREALTAFGVPVEEQAEIIATIREHSRKSYHKTL
jgi:hypothetical protein